MTERPTSERLFTPAFAALLLACVWYFLVTGMMFEAIPRFVSTTLGGQDWGVGVAMGIAGLAAALLRLPAGRLTDLKGRRWVLVLGSAVAGASMLGLLAARSISAVVGFRLLTGLAEAAYFVAAATALQDLAPAGRRGEATSYFSGVAYVGFALGPVLAEWLIKRYSFDVVWLLAAGLSLIAAVLSLRVPQNRSSVLPDGRFWPKPLLHPAARAPGAVLLIGLMGFASFVTFAALWATDVGIARAGDVFMLLAATVLTVRVLTARVVDRIGARATATVALSASAAGLAVMALWQAPAGVYLGTVVLAVGQGFMFPALFTLVILAAPETERGQAVGAFSISFDLAFGLGGVLAGTVANWLGGIPAAFWFGASACGLALVVARAIIPAPRSPRDSNPPPTEGGDAGGAVGGHSEAAGAPPVAPPGHPDTTGFRPAPE
ncbi:MAG: MFS transporter [bacterium]|nr:MFS transporter [bacterium]